MVRFFVVPRKEEALHRDQEGSPLEREEMVNHKTSNGEQETDGRESDTRGTPVQDVDSVHPLTDFLPSLRAYSLVD